MRACASGGFALLGIALGWWWSASCTRAVLILPADLPTYSDCQSASAVDGCASWPR